MNTCGAGRTSLRVWGGLVLVLGTGGCGAEPTPEAARSVPDETRAQTTTPVEVPRWELPPAQPPDALRHAAVDFVQWNPVHGFLDAEVITARVVGPGQAIAATADGHLAVTLTGGRDWTLTESMGLSIDAVGGGAGGPFVAVGPRGHVVLSAKGSRWRTLPKMTGDDLIDVAIQGDILLALGEHGVVARYRRHGEPLESSALPHGFEGRRLVTRDGMFYSIRGPIAYGSADGSIWRKAVAVPVEPRAFGAQTSQGECALEGLRGASRIRCTIEGVAYGLDEESALVVGRDQIGLTRNGGLGWEVSPRPLGKIHHGFGEPDGPYVLLGGSGRIAFSADALTWTTLRIDKRRDLLTGISLPEGLLVAGERGLMLRSTDGGGRWTPVRSGTRKALSNLRQEDGRLLVQAGRRLRASTDGGRTWRAHKARRGKKIRRDRRRHRRGVHPCGDDLPDRGRACVYTRTVRSPEGLPDIEAANFLGDHGIGYGDRTTLTMTPDGGATWRTRMAVTGGPVLALAVSERLVLVTDGASAWVSDDGGRSFGEVRPDRRTGELLDGHIASDGSLYLAGTDGTVLKGSATGDAWIPLAVDPEGDARFERIFEVAHILYVTDDRGRLFRSQDAGATWSPVPGTGAGQVAALTGDARTVIGVLRSRTSGLQTLIRSTDGGRHFREERRLPGTLDFRGLDWTGTELIAGGLMSRDMGATWAASEDHPWPGAVPVGDGRGYSLVQQRVEGGGHRLLLVGQRAEEWVSIDGAKADHAKIACSGSSGCWMLRDGQVYRAGNAPGSVTAGLGQQVP